MPCVMPFITPWVSAVDFAHETKRRRPRKHSPAGPNLEKGNHTKHCLPTRAMLQRRGGQLPPCACGPMDRQNREGRKGQARAGGRAAVGCFQDASCVFRAPLPSLLLASHWGLPSASAAPRRSRGVVFCGAGPRRDRLAMRGPVPFFLRPFGCAGGRGVVGLSACSLGTLCQ